MATDVYEKCPSHFPTRHAIRSGSSGATVRIAERGDRSLIAIKHARSTRVSAAKQAAAREMIAPYFGDRLPEVLYAGPYCGYDMLITACPSRYTFADIAAEHGPTPALLMVWEEILDSFIKVWQDSYRPGYTPELATRNHARRLQRGVDGLAHAFALLRRGLPGPQRFIVNGADLGTWDTLRGQWAALPLPSGRVVCQGDPQPTNILLDSELGWHLIDWEWSGAHHDWRLMTSHLIGWWLVEETRAYSHGTLTTSRSAFELDYSEPDLGRVRPWTDRAMKAFRAMTVPGLWGGDLSALYLHMAMLFLREVPHAATSGHHHLIAPLLGEALRLADAANGGAPPASLPALLA